ncbi:hypothetical protein [Luteipulveratus mongoliensis]|uniref:Transmembrane protein n=1 Tax=Luteipulveratus mongoliensis TaxID=571913 RepID=A0A0K1JJM3_9MICO|nr:hypothetical protein [Luteipulveratus mongoliensis]AKU16770.1 hypothetical protein VV02_14320 [Luteipulveratus mongoliensis]
MPEDHDSRTLISPRTGTKVCLLVALPFLLAAAYFFFVPITLRGSTGSTFNCDSAASAPTGSFQKGTCGDLNTINRYRAIALGATGLLIGGLGSAMFGVERRQELRPRRDHEDEDERPRRDRDEERDRPRRRRDEEEDQDDSRSRDRSAFLPDDDALRGARRGETTGSRGSRRLDSDDESTAPAPAPSRSARRYEEETRSARHELDPDDPAPRRRTFDRPDDRYDD